MFTLNLALDVMQFGTLAALAVMNGIIAYSVLKIQRDRNTPKLVMYVDDVDDEDRYYDCLYVQNVGLVPALNVRIVVDIEEWREEHPVRSAFHERFETFEDDHVSLNPQEFRRYELPYAEGWALIITAIALCRNGSSESLHFAYGDDRGAFREVFSDKGSKRAVKKLKSKVSSKKRGSQEIRFTMGLTSLKDYDKEFRDQSKTSILNS